MSMEIYKQIARKTALLFFTSVIFIVTTKHNLGADFCHFLYKERFGFNNQHKQIAAIESSLLLPKPITFCSLLSEIRVTARKIKLNIRKEKVNCIKEDLYRTMQLNRKTEHWKFANSGFFSFLNVIFCRRSEEARRSKSTAIVLVKFFC